MSAFLIALLLPLGCAHSTLFPTTTIRVGEIPMKVEVADDVAERAQGLQHREDLPADRGMLFVYPDSRPRSFWMEFTTIPLSIAFADEGGQIVHITDMKPLDRTSVPSGSPAMYALEVNRGWFASHSVEVGAVLSDLPGPSTQ